MPESTGTTSRNVHLLVLIHGLWGAPSHLDYIAETIEREAKKDKETTLIVLRPDVNEWTNTYDGIDVCAERIVDDITEESQHISARGDVIQKFSILGYSLGGLVARYAIGILEGQRYFDTVQATNFTTFASPWIGYPNYASTWSKLFRSLGQVFLSRSGDQIYLKDRYLPVSYLASYDADDFDSWLAPKKSLFKSDKEPALPLVAALAHPKLPFYQALRRFTHIDLYASAINDRTVPFPTGAAEPFDPFGLSKVKAEKAAKAKGLETSDIEDGGLRLKLSSDGIFIKGYEFFDSPAVVPIKHKRQFKLPRVLRPTSYPFSRPVSLFIIATFPITFPLLLLGVFAKMGLETVKSRKRIRIYRKRLGSGRLGTFERVGLRVREAVEEVVENIQPDQPGDDSVLFEKRNGDSLLNNSSSFNTRSFSTSATPIQSAIATPVDRSQDRVVIQEPTPEQSREAKELFTDPNLTPSQFEMIKQINSIPQLRKHFVYLPNVLNAHATIIARVPTMAMHQLYGTKVVKSWARQFKL